MSQLIYRQSLTMSHDVERRKVYLRSSSIKSKTYSEDFLIKVLLSKLHSKGLRRIHSFKTVNS